MIITKKLNTNKSQNHDFLSNDVTSNRSVFFDCLFPLKEKTFKKKVTPTKTNGGKFSSLKGSKVFSKIVFFDPIFSSHPACMPQAKVILATSPQGNPATRQCHDLDPGNCHQTFNWQKEIKLQP